MTTYKSMIGADDLNLYNGVNRTFTRTSPSGGSVTMPRIGNSVDVLQVYGDGVTPTEGTLRAAISAVGALERTLELAPGAWPLATNLTTPANISFRLCRGAYFNVTSTNTLNVSASCILPEETTGWYVAGSGTVTVDNTKVFVPTTPGQVYVSANDTTLGYLNGKLTAGAGVTLTEGTDGGNETLAIAAPTAGKVSSNDTTAGYLNGKLVAGSGVTLTENNNGADETLTIAATYGGGLGAVKVYTSDATWTKPTGLKAVKVWVVGGGGAGASSDGRKGGGGGGASMKYIVAASLGATEAVTVGAGGALATAGNDGGDGGTSSFGTHLSATGGKGGKSPGTATSGAGGAGATGDVNLMGGAGSFAVAGDSFGGNAPGPYGGGVSGPDQDDQTPRVGNNYGGGSAGSISAATATLAGAGGIVVVEEYYL